MNMVIFILSDVTANNLCFAVSITYAKTPTLLYNKATKTSLSLKNSNSQ